MRAQVRRGAPEPFRFPELIAPELDRRDSWIAAAVGLLAAAAFAVTFSPNVAAGDPPEYIAGVRALGILHAPGYPAYVLAARGFAALVPIGSLTFRVLLFSLVAAALAIAGLYLVARCVHASRLGAAVGALSVAVGASYWYDATTAKHYAFSAFLVVVAALCALRWEARGGARLLVCGAVAVGVCFGAEWQVALITLVAVVVLALKGSRRMSRVVAVVCSLTMVAIAAGCYAFVYVRAGQHPGINWGDASTIGRLAQLISQRDFGSTYSTAVVSNPVARYALRVVSYPAIVFRDIGFGAAALLVIGIVGIWMRGERGTRWFLAVLAALNVVGVIAVVNVDTVLGFRSTIYAGGYLLDLMMVIAVLIAVGLTLVVQAGRDYLAKTDWSPTGWIFPTGVGALVVLVLVPSLVFHYEEANHRIPAFVDDYGSRVLEALPANSVLVAYRYDWELPMTYRQVVKGERRDVATFNLSSLSLGWYRDDMQRRFGIIVPKSGGLLAQTIAVVNALRKTRSVYLDPGAMQVLHQQIGYRFDGFDGEVVNGTGPQPVRDLAAKSARVAAMDEADHVIGNHYVRFLNDGMLYLRARVHVELAKDYVLAKDNAGAVSEMQRAYDIYPEDPAIAAVLPYLQQSGPAAYKLLLDI
jgi:hypothetical protein